MEVVIADYSYIGCYNDHTINRDLSANARTFANWQNLTEAQLAEACYSFCDGYRYFGIQYSGECYCDNDYGGYGEGTTITSEQLETSNTGDYAPANGVSGYCAEDITLNNYYVSDYANKIYETTANTNSLFIALDSGLGTTSDSEPTFTVTGTSEGYNLRLYLSELNCTDDIDYIAETTAGVWSTSIQVHSDHSLPAQAHDIYVRSINDFDNKSECSSTSITVTELLPATCGNHVVEPMSSVMMETQSMRSFAITEP